MLHIIKTYLAWKVINLNIPSHLIDKIKSIPEKPGVYKMKDSQGNIIYIGKSKCLSRRVKSYFQTRHQREKIKRLVFNIKDIDFIVTDTHLEAQLLECKLIKKHRPIYNSQFTKDKNYVYLKIEDNVDNEPLSITLEKEGKHLFGPFRSRRFLYDLIALMSKLYPIKKIGASYQFEYNPLPGSMDKKTFEENKRSLIEIFSHEKCMESFIKLLKEKMEEASAAFLFERASHFRDIMLAMKYIYRTNKNNITKDKRLIMGEKIEEGYKLFYIDDGNLINKRKFHNLSVKDIASFIKEAKKAEKNNSIKRNEKRNVDYKIIINRELRDKNSKVIAIIDENFNIKSFWSELMKL